MKNRNFPLVLLVICLFIAFMAALYISNRYEAYNGVIDTVFSDIASLFSSGGKKHDDSVHISNQENTVTISDSTEPEVTVSKTLQKDMFEFTDNGYTLASTGRNKWYSENSWPYVAEPVILRNTVITITAEPAFLILDYETGELLSKESCPVYPSEHMFLDGTILTVTGRDEKEYTFRVEDDYCFTDMRSEEKDPVGGAFLSKLIPDDKQIEFMTNRIREWTADDSRNLPDMQLYTGHINQEGNGNFWAQKNQDRNIVFYVFTPDSQGIYQIGLADENGVWIQANAFVAVFGEKGDMKQVSIDYVANKPQVKLHLSETEIYYIVAGWAKDMYNGTSTWLQIAESR